MVIHSTEPHTAQCLFDNMEPGGFIHLICYALQKEDNLALISYILCCIHQIAKHTVSDLQSIYNVYGVVRIGVY